MLVFSGETLKEERLSKSGVGDHSAERFADHELGSCYRGRAAADPWLERIYRTTLFDS
jgi:hypothetical protein